MDSCHPSPADESRLSAFEKCLTSDTYFLTCFAERAQGSTRGEACFLLFVLTMTSPIYFHLVVL